MQNLRCAAIELARSHAAATTIPSIICIDRPLAAVGTDRNETCNVFVLKEEVMANRTHRIDVAPPFSSSPNDEGSRIRECSERAPTLPPPKARKSDRNLSLDQRLESKLATAAALLARLEPQDARARLLHIAMLRRDESLLDGILAELSSPPVVRRSR